MKRTKRFEHKENNRIVDKLPRQPIKREGEAVKTILDKIVPYQVWRICKDCHVRDINTSMTMKRNP